VKNLTAPASDQSISSQQDFLASHLATPGSDEARMMTATSGRRCLESYGKWVRMGLGEVLSDLASAGYCVGCAVVPACAVNAPHRRDRVWIMAYRDEPGLQGYRGLCADSGRELPAGQGSGSELGEGQSERGLGGAAHGISTWLDGSWEGQIPRVIKGQKGRVPRLKALGNAVVPKLAQAIGHGVMSHAERG
jgi:hypothetical protein